MPNTISLTSINQLSAEKLVDSFQKLDGKLDSGYIDIAGEKYKLSFKYNNSKINIRAEREYTGKFAFFKNLFFTKRTNSAYMLAQKVQTILKSPHYKMLYNNLKEFHNIIRENKGKATVEVANYGFSKTRDVVKNAMILNKFNNHFQTQIQFNKIDDYNDHVNITPTSLNAIEYKDTLSKIANGQLDLNVDANSGLTEKRLTDWANFLARPENLKKIDIPKKLFEYLHQNTCNWASNNKTTGWKAEFSANPDKALRNFIIKNLSYGNRDVSEEELQTIQKKLKEYVEIYNIADDQVRKQKMDDFFKLEKWQNAEEKNVYQQEFDNYVAEGEDPKDVEDFLNQSKGTFSTKSFQLLTSILNYATFRQTSKLGLKFFHEQKVPVLFQYSDNKGKSLKNTSNTIIHENFWKSGQRSKDGAGSLITYSEMRQVERMKKELGDAFNIKLAYGG